MIYKKERVAIDMVCFFIAAGGILLVNKDRRIFAICILPLLINHVVQSFMFGETTAGGVPGLIKKSEKPLLFGFIVVISIVVLVSDLFYLFFTFF
jgi:hypothetical protein